MTGTARDQELPYHELLGHGLRLRAWREEDAPAMLHGLADPEVLRWAGGQEYPRDLAGTRALLRKRADRVRTGDLAPYCVVDAGTDAVLGSIEMHQITRAMGHAGLGYWLLPSARGRGVVTRAVELITRWGFDDVGLHRLDIGHEVGNEPSCRVAVRCGYVFEGTLRGFLPSATGYADSHLHARLASDPAPRLP